MSESQNDAVNNAAGDCNKVNILEENLESMTNCQQNNLDECKKPAVFPTSQVAGGDSQSEKVISYLM
jgi:hypothetical protein